MTVQRSERFDADLERQFRWYLVEADLDPADALALVGKDPISKQPDLV
jgi:hypothetical protein